MSGRRHKRSSRSRHHTRGLKLQQEDERGHFMDNLGMLDLLGIDKPVPDSHLSEKQIAGLFDKWREFMMLQFKANAGSDRAAWQQVNQLFSNATSIKQKYDALRFNVNSGYGHVGSAMSDQKERDWIMGDSKPTPFIQWIQGQARVMENLRMAFKPQLLHSGMIEAPDLVNLLTRYVFWFCEDKDRNLNLLTVIDGSSPVQSSTALMVQRLEKLWSNYRFHVALLNEHTHWCTILIDRKEGTFEYYDPLGRGLDLSDPDSPMANQVRALYDVAQRMATHPLISKTLDTIGDHEHRHQRGGEECGMYNVLFIHNRVAYGRTFEQFAEMRISSQDCYDRRRLFFDTTGLREAKVLKQSLDGTVYVKPEEEDSSEKVYKDYKMEYGNYDIRVAGIVFIEYLNGLLSAVPQIQAPIQQAVSEMSAAIQSMQDYIMIRVRGVEIQNKILIPALDPALRQYWGADIWFSIIEEVVKDPLTRYLRRAKHEKGSRSSSRVREAEALKFFDSITGWSRMMGAAPDKVAGLRNRMTTLINQVYIPVLRFERGDVSKYLNVTSPQAFLKETMRRKQTVAMGVHFLRDIARWVLLEMRFDPFGPGTDLEKFALKTQRIKPVTVATVQQIRQVMSSCDQAVMKAKQLLQQAFNEQMQLQTTTNTLPTTPSLTGYNQTLTSLPQYGTGIPFHQVTNMPQYGVINTSFPSTRSPNAQRVKAHLVQDMNERTFLRSGLQSWYVPMNFTEFLQSNTTPVSETLKSNMVAYSLTDGDFTVLLSEGTQQHSFLTYYIASMIVLLQVLKRGSPTLPGETATLMLQSVMQFLRHSNNNQDVRKALCGLASMLKHHIQQLPQQGLVEANFLSELGMVVNAICAPFRQTYNMEQDPFFRYAAMLASSLFQTVPR